MTRRPPESKLTATLLPYTTPFRSAQRAQADIDGLIEGETGTGKELGAHMLHRQSRRSGGALVAVNCAALPHEVAEGELFGSDLVDRASGRLGRPGRIRSAHRGTLFLDEIDRKSVV